MRKSDVFEEFVKIAEEKGMLSGVTSEEAKRKLEENPRMDSLDISAIEALYGVKPETSKGMEYENNIAELAHPNSVVVSPSYDKINGLVENINERQTILLNILDKTPDGMLRQKKYAEQEFILNLVRVGNDLDNKNYEELRVLADKCLEQIADLKKKDEIVKTAWVPVAIGIVAALGVLYAQQHLPFANKGFQKNHEALIGEIDDLIQSNADWGFGTEYSQNFKQEMYDFKWKVLDFKLEIDRILPIIENMDKPRSAQELIEISQNFDASEANKAYEMLDKKVREFSVYLDQIKDNFKDNSYKLRQVQDKGVLTRLVDWTKGLSGGYGLFADDFDDVVRAVGPYEDSIKGFLKVLGGASSFKQKSKEKVESAISEAKPEAKPEDAGEKSPKSKEKGPKSVEDQLLEDEEDFADLQKFLERT